MQTVAFGALSHRGSHRTLQRWPWGRELSFQGGAHNQQDTNRDWLIILAKQPLRGLAKTRLARDIGVDRADAFAQAFLLDTLAQGVQYPGVQLLIAFTPSTARSWFEQQAPSAEFFAQPERSFGVRMHAATREAFVRGARRCVLIGTDTPHLEPQTISRAFDALDSTEVCLGPCHDGGYYLIGLRRDQPQLFSDVPWSTDKVLATTLERAAASGLSVSQLTMELDIDEGSDLEALGSILEQRGAVAAATRAVLSRLSEEDP